MKWTVIVSVVLVLCVGVAIAETPLLNTPIHDCVRCICHAVSGCYKLQNCAQYSINFNYWETARAPVVNLDDNPDQNGYKNCMKNDNCIVNTIHNYTEVIGEENTADCNCDDSSNCFDKLAIHLKSCDDPLRIPKYQVRKQRFETCMGQSYNDPPNNC